MFPRKPEKHFPPYNETALALMSLPTLLGINLAAQVIVFWLSGQEGLFPGADGFQSILSSCSEIIAGLYGTTLAGYTFFLSRIDALTASDATLDYVVNSIKNRFKYLIWYITFNVLITLFISIALMYAPAPSGAQTGYFYRLFCNEFLLFLGFSIGLVLYYSILVVNPNCVEKEAARLKSKLCRPGPDGSAAEFIALWDRIETLCHQLLPETVRSRIQQSKGCRFDYTLELLEEQQLLPQPLIAELTHLHRYYQCAVNCSPLRVHEQMYLLSHRVLATLEYHHPRQLLPN